MTRVILKLGKEEWRTISDWPYEVSSWGRVRRAKVGMKNTYVGKVLSPVMDGNYLVVSLANKGVTKNFTIHYLVCSAWHGPRPAGLVIRHLDGVHTNNWPTNLAWGTQAENNKDKVKHGVSKMPESAKELLSRLQKGVPKSKEHVANYRAAWADPTIRARRIASLQEASRRPEIREKRRAAALARWQPDKPL